VDAAEVVIAQVPLRRAGGHGAPRRGRRQGRGGAALPAVRTHLPL